MEWLAIVDAIIQMISECMDNRSRANIEAGLKRPRLRERWACKHVLREELGLVGVPLIKATNNAMRGLKNMDDEDRTMALDAAEVLKATRDAQNSTSQAV